VAVRQKRGMTTTNTATDWDLIEAHLSAGWREVGDEMGLIRDRPQHMGTITDLGVARRLLFHQAGTSASLRAMTAREAVSLDGEVALRVATDDGVLDETDDAARRALRLDEHDRGRDDLDAARQR